MKTPQNYLIVFWLTIAYSCSYDKVSIAPETGYPENIENILVNKCATDGCHNSISRSAAAGLDFSTWDVMFEGGRNGTSVIPYSTDYSFLLYTVNTDTSKGPVLSPTMPYLREPLSDSEYQALVDWIANGAPDKNGFVKFSDNPNRRKIYICMQGCDKVCVIDAESKVIMRYISVGNDPNSIEAPHQVKLSPDNQYWYAVFYSGSTIQKFRTSDDSLVATLDLDNGVVHPWNTMMITPDSKTGFVNALDDRVAVVNLETMTLVTTLSYPVQPHGGFITPDGRYLYLTCQTGNFIYKIDLNSAPFYDEDSLVVVLPGAVPSTNSSAQPHEATLSPDGSKYFVSLQGTAQVSILQLSNDSILAVLPVGAFPQEFSFSESYPYAFVTCREGPVSPGKRGAVYAINYNTLVLMPQNPIYTGYQPHGIAVDDAGGLVYVANLNFDPNAPAPHHVTSCAGRNGNLTLIQLNSLTLYNQTLSDGASFQYKNELLPFPYFVSLRK